MLQFCFITVSDSEKTSDKGKQNRVCGCGFQPSVLSARTTERGQTAGTNHGPNHTDHEVYRGGKGEIIL